MMSTWKIKNFKNRLQRCTSRETGAKTPVFFVLIFQCRFCLFLEEGAFTFPVSWFVVPCPSTCDELKPIVEGSCFRLPIVFTSCSYRFPNRLTYTTRNN